MDHVLVSRRSAASVIDCKTWWWASFGSDHGHVLMGARLRSKVEPVTSVSRTMFLVRHGVVQMFRKQVADWLVAEAGKEWDAELVWKRGR